MLRKIFFTFLIAVSVYPQSIKTKLDQLLTDEFYQSCVISISVEDLTTNKTLYTKNEKYLLRPASNMKVLTSAAGLLYLEPDYEFKTDLYYDGIISNDTLYGNIYVVGGCDPDFSTNDLYTFVDAIKSLNISVIAGDIIGDVSFKDSLYWGSGWMWDDDPSSDAPYLNALNINDNCVTVNYFGKNDSVEINPKTNYAGVIRLNTDDKLTIDRNWLERKNDIVIKGFDNKNNYSEMVNVLNPDLYFLKVFSEVLDSNQIKVSGNFKIDTVNDNQIFLTSFTRKYSDVIGNLNKESDNLSAEMTLSALAEKYFGKPANAKNGIKIITQMIEEIGLKPDDYRLADGSGVSHYNVVTTELLVKLLKYFYSEKPELYNLLYDSFPIGGVDGTLEKRMLNTSLKNNVHAKTGTLTGVSSLSGYLTSKNKHLIAFSIIQQSYLGSSSTAKKFEDDICKIIYEY
ncbi:MAG: D-alanyl-D-alanine carboxypeptidase/D-alanyl-D-alanine-endopeptidase [Ignavibacteriaceae bacterium]|jgi:D-alanyl-D-alanine carboxypeptidase/D-alanyl-D-alanine-endopeptidase (penicillin-binding protein 4)|nr:D-alanyl-D-alanine carboxypeptidase/D-alanyl-D-alanine-endopeptidase [Ignavibacteriaceae bacterium]